MSIPHRAICTISTSRSLGASAARDIRYRTQNSPGAGWEFVHVSLDDNSRVAFANIQPDESGSSACRALLSALRYYRSFGIAYRRVLTDNGTCYKSLRFVQAALREWAYARTYESSNLRAQQLPALAASLQLAQTACQPSISATNLPHHRTEQPAGVTQVVGSDAAK